MAYGIYQPKILKKLDFAELAAWLGIIQGLLAAFIEPLIGAFSDRIQRRLGSRLPMISVGVTLAGLIFVAASLLVEQNLQGGMRWLVPILMTVWVMAMIVFRGPAIALLRQLAPDKELPQANAVLVLVFGLVGAIGLLLDILLKSIGASITFILGAIALVMGAYILRLSNPTHTLGPSIINHSVSDSPISKLLLILIFLIGLGAGLEVNLLLSIFPKVLQSQLPNIKLEFIASGILWVSAIASVPLAQLTVKLGANQTMLLGLGTIAALMKLTLSNYNNMLAIGLILAFGIAFGLVFIGMIPLALGMLPPTHAGLSTGLYFGGGGGATAIVSLLMIQADLTPVTGFFLSAIAFLVVAFSIVISQKINS